MSNLTFKLKTTFMKFDLETIHKLISYFDELKLLPQEAKPNLLCMAKGEFLFAEQLSIAESIHFHIKVESTADLSHDKILQYGGRPQNAKEGYIKYAFLDGYNFIFSSIPVSEEEKAGVSSFNYPHLDHIGIDIREENPEAFMCFNKIPEVAASNMLPLRRQGGNGKNVYCCHVQVSEKYWVYPPGNAFLEFAFGKLLVSENIFGCDLRPADPALGLFQSDKQSCCGSLPAANKCETQTV